MVKYNALGLGSVQESDREQIKNDLPEMALIAYYIDKKTKYAKLEDANSGILKFDARVGKEVKKFRTTSGVLIKQFGDIAKNVGVSPVKDPETGVVWSRFKEEVEIDGIVMHPPSVTGKNPYPTIKVNLP